VLSQFHQSERSWVRFPVGTLKIARPQDSHVSSGLTRKTR